MIVRTAAQLLLVGSIALALPLAVEAWLHGAHVTAEQGLWHAHAVARHGDHDHRPARAAHLHQDAAPHLAASVQVEAGSFTVATLLSLLSTLGQAMAVAAVLAFAPDVGRLGRRWLDRRLASHIPDLTLPPPRSLRVLPA